MEDSPQDECVSDLISRKLKIAMTVAAVFSIFTGFFAVLYSLYTLFKVISPTEIVSVYFIVPLMVHIFIGIIFPFFTFIGCRGAIKEKPKPLRVCYIAMYVLMIITFALGIYTGASTLSTAGRKRILPLEQAIFSYHDDIDLSTRINSIQRNLKCCGISGLNDWNSNAKFYCDSMNHDHQRCNLPASCCVTFKDKRRKLLIYRSGCQKKVDDLVHSIAGQIIGILISLVFEQFIVMKLSSYIALEFTRVCQFRCSAAYIRNNLQATTTV